MSELDKLNADLKIEREKVAKLKQLVSTIYSKLLDADRMSADILLLIREAGHELGPR